MGLSPGNRVAVEVMSGNRKCWGSGMHLTPHPNPYSVCLVYSTSLYSSSLLLPLHVHKIVTEDTTPSSWKATPQKGTLQYFPWYSIFHCLISHHLSHLRTENRRQGIRGEEGEQKQAWGRPWEGNHQPRTEEKRRREDAGKKGRPEEGNCIL